MWKLQVFTPVLADEIFPVKHKSHLFWSWTFFFLILKINSHSYRVLVCQKFLTRVFPRPFQMGGQNLYFWPPICFHSWGVSLKSHKNYLRRGSVLKIYEPHLKILTPYGFLNAYFLFSLPFYWFFMLIFPNFSWISAYFHGGSDPPDPPPFFRWGQKFFSWGVR